MNKNDILESLNILIIQRAFSPENFLYLLGHVATALTIVGLPLNKLFIKLFDFKNRKTVKYMICNKVRTKLDAVTESSIVVLYFFKCYYFLLFAIVYFLFVQYVLNIIEQNKSALGIVFALVIGSSVIRRILEKGKCIKNIFKIIIAIFAVIVIAVHNILLYYKQTYVLVLTLILGFISLDVIISRIPIGIYARKCYKKNVAVFVFLRHLIFYATYLLQMVYSANENILYLGYSGWLIFASIEMVINLRTMGDTTLVNIHTSQGIKRTKSRIMQHECNKVKYILEDGLMEIVDETDVLYISYAPPERILTMIWERIQGEACIECFLKDSGTEESVNNKFSAYQYKNIGESWISLYMKDGAGKRVTIINTNRIKRITYKRNVFL